MEYNYDLCEKTSIPTLGGYTVDQILNNKNCSKDPKYWVNIEGTDRYLFKSSVAESWEFFYPYVTNPVRNTNQIYLKFKDVKGFTPMADKYKSSSAYTSYPQGTVGYNVFWDAQEDLCSNGLMVDGVRITGRHYFYLNYSRIKARPVSAEGKEDTNSNRKIETFPSFLDHNYYWFNEIEENYLDGLYSNQAEYFKWFPNKTNKDFKTLKKVGHICTKARRKGYEQPHSEIVMTPYGYTTMGDIKVGDYVLNPNGKPTKVIDKFPQGAKDIYEITLFDGRKVKCGLEHLWKIYGRSSWGNRTTKTVSTKFLLEEDLKPGVAYKWFLKVNNSIEYEEKSLPIPAYTLGCILGNDNVTEQFKINSIDNEVIDRVLGELKLSELNIKSRFKYIPEVYKRSSKTQRLELVKGLMDTNGTIRVNGNMSFRNTSKQLVLDLQHVLYSLGITSTFKTRKDGIFIIYINSSKNLFHLTHKKVRVIKDKKHREFIAITSVKKLDYKEESSCISVDAEDQLYLTRDFIPTHNTYQITGGILSYNYNFLEASTSIIAAFEKGHYKVTLDGTHYTLNFLNKATDWAKRRQGINRRDHFRASYKYVDDFGVEIEAGYMSEIMAVSTKDNFMKSIGDSVDTICYEEAGKFEKLIETHVVNEPMYRDGDIMIGVPIAWGSAGDMERGSVDLSLMFNDPAPYSFKAYTNIYDDNAENATCGWFIDDMWYYPGTMPKEDILKNNTKFKYLENTLDLIEGEDVEFVDKFGNSYRMFAEISLDQKRKVKKKGDVRAYQKFITQQPKTPKEAFLLNEGSPFDIASLKEVLSNLMTSKEFNGETGKFALNEQSKPMWRLDLNLPAITEFPLRSTSIDGCWVIWEHPKRVNGEIPYNRYIGGLDPIDFGRDEVVTDTLKHSLASTFIFDTFTKRIVAEYTARPATANEYYEQLWRGVEYYNGTLLYENNLKGVYSYLLNKDKTYLLANEPNHLKDRFGYKGKNNKKGFHATESINAYARKQIDAWSMELTSVEDGKEIPRMFLIKSKPLLEELIRWHSKGNFDRVSSLGAVFIYLAEFEKYIDQAKEQQKNIFDDPFWGKLNKNKRNNNGLKLLKQG